MTAHDLSGRTLGEFVLREQIGEGGYGAVYRCEQPALRREVVVKVLRKQEPVAEERFLREARMASRLEHPYAAHVYAFGAELDGLLWIAMERVPGVTLKDWLESRGAMPLEQFVPFFECVAEVVQAAHDRGIIHRDLKPSNIMVIERGERLIPKLLDFGIAKIDDDDLGQPVGARDASGRDAPTAPGADRTVTAPARGTPNPDRAPSDLADETRTSDEPLVVTRGLTRTGVGMGSRAYMSPEQWTDAGSVGPSSDIYSLGIVAYQALTGRVPFSAEHTREYHDHHLSGEVPPLGGDFAPEVDRVIRRALAKDPCDRQRSAIDLAAQLRAALRAQPQEQLRSLAQVWDAQARPATLLLKGGDLLRAPADATGELERTFVAASRRSAARRSHVRRALIAAALVLAALWYRSQLKAEQQAELAKQETRSAQQLADAIATQSELEQGRAALLHNEPGALHHLAEAYRRDPAPSTAFMLARAIQPRLAELARLPSSFGRMESATFSPDGAQIVTTDEKNAQIWDATTYRLRFTLPHGERVYRAIYSRDGATIFTSSDDGAVRIWDSSHGTLLRELRHDRKHRYGDLTISPDGKLVAVLDVHGQRAHVWRIEGALVADLPNVSAAVASTIAFSADGRWLALSGDDVHVFDASTWAQVTTLPGPAIQGSSWDPTGPRLVTGSARGDVAIWSIPRGERMHHLREIGESVLHVAFSGDGGLVVAASSDGTEQVWDARTGTLRSQGNFLHSQIRSVEFDRTSARIVAAAANGSVAVSDGLQNMPLALLDGAFNVVDVAHFDPSSRRVVGASWDGTARIWDVTPPYRRWSTPPISDFCAVMTKPQPDQRFLAVACRDHATTVWDTVQGRLLAELPSARTDDTSTPIYPAVSAAGDRAAIARDHTAGVYELPGGRLVRTIEHGAPVTTVAFAQAGHDIVSGAEDGSLIVTHGDGSAMTLATGGTSIDVAGFLPDGRVLAADARRRLRIYRPDGALSSERTLSARVKMLRVSHDGQRLLTLGSFSWGHMGAPELWETTHDRVVAQLEDPGHAQVYSASFTADGQILTGCGDGAVRLWDGRTGQLRTTYRGGSRYINDAVLSPDGAMIIGGDGDGVLRFWDAGSGRMLWAMQAHRSHVVGVHTVGDDIVTRGFWGDVTRWTLPRPEQTIAACRAHPLCALALR